MAQNVLNFSFFFKFWQNHMLAPPGGSAQPPMGIPGSAPVKGGGDTITVPAVRKKFNFLHSGSGDVETMDEYACT